VDIESLGFAALVIVMFSLAMACALLCWMVFSIAVWYSKGFSFKQSVEFMWEEIV